MRPAAATTWKVGSSIEAEELLLPALTDPSDVELEDDRRSDARRRVTLRDGVDREQPDARLAVDTSRAARRELHEDGELDAGALAALAALHDVRREAEPADDRDVGRHVVAGAQVETEARAEDVAALDERHGRHHGDRAHLEHQAPGRDRLDRRDRRLSGRGEMTACSATGCASCVQFASCRLDDGRGSATMAA